MKHKKMAILLVLTFLFITAFNGAGTVSADSSRDTWIKLLEKRSSSIFTEAIDLGGLLVGGRGKIMFTWLDRSLLRTMERNMDVSDVIIEGLGYYISNKKEVSALLKNRDVFLLTYQAIKRWDFKIEEIVINGYRLTMGDILSPPFYRVLGEIMPLRVRERMAEDEDEDLSDYQLHVAVPSMPKKGKVILSYGDDTVEWEIPKL